MVYSPYDFNEASRNREEYVEDKLRQGSPIVGVSYDAGLALLTVRKTQRKVFEIYDRLVFSAIGKQADIEKVRTAAIDVAHREGFERSPDDVTAQRLVGFALSPALRQVFGEQLSSPAVIRAVFGEMAGKADEDLFYVLNYDGEFSVDHGFAVVAGTPEAEECMAAWMQDGSPDAGRDAALGRALHAWALGALESRRAVMARDDDEPNPLRDIDDAEEIGKLLTEELRTSHVEVGVLDRASPRESKFHLLSAQDLAPVVSAYTSG